jgi:methionine synthase II (cobalamin-independent)
VIEEVEDLVDQVIRLRDRLEPADVALVPSCDLEFLPWACAEKKVRRLGEAAAALREVLG